MIKDHEHAEQLLAEHANTPRRDTGDVRLVRAVREFNYNKKRAQNS
jgi:hypothetical protein